MAKNKENAALCGELRKMGFEVNVNGKKGKFGANSKTVSVSGKLNAVLALAEKAKDLPFALPENQSEVKRHTSNDHDSWRGGTMADLSRALSGEVDMTPFLEARKRFETSDIGSKLTAKFALNTPQRKRRFSDKDGEWMLHRKWEIEPFQDAVKTVQAGKYIDLNCHFAISGANGSKVIDDYGATIWAINDLIEKSGVKTRIFYVVQGNDNCEENDCEMRIMLKDHGQYLAPSMLAACVTSNFYRRLGFVLYVLAADAVNKRVYGGLGRVPNYTKCIDFSDGAVNFYPGMIGANYSSWDTQAEKAVLEAIA